MDYFVGFDGCFGSVTGSNADGRHSAPYHSGNFGCYDLPLQQSGKEHFPEYRTGVVGFVQYGYRFVG